MAVQWSLDSPEMRDLIGKIAEWPHGLGFLHLADVDTISVTLHVNPFLVAAAREALESEEGRARLIREVQEARRKAGHPLHPPPCPEPCPPSVAPRMGADGLIEAARKHPLGIEFLAGGDLEAVAVVFHVHPRTVTAAREKLRGREAGNAPDED